LRFIGKSAVLNFADLFWFIAIMINGRECLHLILLSDCSISVLSFEWPFWQPLDGVLLIEIGLMPTRPSLSWRCFQCLASGFSFCFAAIFTDDFQVIWPLFHGSDSGLWLNVRIVLTIVGNF